jgi:hypothetical protein
MRKRLGRWSAALTAASALVLAGATVASAATSHAVIDFEGLAAGAVVDSVAHGSGISGDPIPGWVTVFGDSADPEILTNAAIVFDATCGGVPTACSGNDDDLYKPQLGKVLIMAEDLIDKRPADGIIDDPDDADLHNAPFLFDFSNFGDGEVTIDSIDLLDVEAVETPATIKVFDGATLLLTIPVGATGNNGLVTVPVGATGDNLVITLEGSGAIDNIRVSIEEEEEEELGSQGCTPGFWKNHESAWGLTGYSMSDSYNTVFGVSWTGGVTLGDAIGAKGGGFNALARHSVAALLNASHPDIDYPMTSTGIIAAVQAAYAGGDPEPLKDQLDANNNLGCSIDG